MQPSTVNVSYAFSTAPTTIIPSATVSKSKSVDVTAPLHFSGVNVSIQRMLILPLTSILPHTSSSESSCNSGNVCRYYIAFNINLLRWSGSATYVRVSRSNPTNTGAINAAYTIKWICSDFVNVYWHSIRQRWLKRLRLIRSTLQRQKNDDAIEYGITHRTQTRVVFQVPVSMTQYLFCRIDQLLLEQWKRYIFDDSRDDGWHVDMFLIILSCLPSYRLFML
jgi:hypothetical protein